MHSALEKAKEILGGDSFPACDSASLRLEKFVQLGENSKAGEVKAVVSKAQGRIPSFTPRGAVQFVAKLGERLIVNQAGGILENAGLCLHRHFNAPYIPGSAVKGCARHAAWQAWHDADEGEQKVAAAKEVAEVFGYPTCDKEGLDRYLEEKCGYGKAQSGKVAFLAAVPKERCSLVSDVLTPHKGNDWTNPVPCEFPAVREGAEFVFTVVPCGSSDPSLAEKARAFLSKGLVVNGIGAKTNAGYGHFVIDGTPDRAVFRTRLRMDSPAFLRGAVNDEGGLRISTLRGMLRWWWRWLYRSILSERDLKDLEKRIWGGCGDGGSKASSVGLRFGASPCVLNRYPFDKIKKTPRGVQQYRTSGLSYLSYGMDEKNGRRMVLDPRPGDGCWELLVDVVARDPELTIEMLVKHVRLAIWALCSYGGIGSRSRKGFGSLSSDIAYADDNAVFADLFSSIQGLAYRQNLDDEPMYSMFGSIREDITVGTTNVWKVLDRIGYAMQGVAADYKHDGRKAVLGLPRQIHGPKREPMDHQRRNPNAHHKPPLPLCADSHEVKGRFASPLAVHISRVGDGLKVALTAFPSDKVRNYETSKELLEIMIQEIVDVLSDIG